MANRVLLDVNVCLNWLLFRTPHADTAGRIFKAVEENEIDALISGISFDTMFYVMRRNIGATQATTELKNLLNHFQIGIVNKNVIKHALKVAWPDLEDAIQYYNAVYNNCDAIITRNTGDFFPKELPVLKPEEYISTHLP